MQEEVIFRRAVSDQLTKYEATDMGLVPQYKIIAHKILQAERLGER
jgi:hypothetical protein